MTEPIGALLLCRVAVASWLTVTLKEPLIASAFAVAVRMVGEPLGVSVLAALALILDRLASAAPGKVPEIQTPSPAARRLRPGAPGLIPRLPLPDGDPAGHGLELVGDA